MRLFLVLIVLFSGHMLFGQHRLYDLLITEFMADPAPVVSLPNAEFVEVYNNTNDTISLLNWQLADAATTALIRSNYLLPPHQYLIICGNNNVNSFSAYGPTLGITGFPNLNNDEDKIILIDPGGKTIHEIHYTLQWYKDPFKEQGGFTIEMIDLSAPCLGEINYEASIDHSGGTPGRENSISRIITDTSKPSIRNAFITDERHISLHFDKPMFPEVTGTIAVLSTVANYSFTISDIIFINEKQLLIQITEYLSLQQQYKLVLSH